VRSSSRPPASPTASPPSTICGSPTTSQFLDRCFAADVVEAHGQPFLFKPRPPLFIGGSPPHAFRRVVEHAAGWMPIGGEPGALREPIAALRAYAAERGAPPPEVAVLTRIGLGDTGVARAQLAAWQAVGATHVIHGERYPDLAGFRRALGGLAAAVR